MVLSLYYLRHLNTKTHSELTWHSTTAAAVIRRWRHVLEISFVFIFILRAKLEPAGSLAVEHSSYMDLAAAVVEEEGTLEAEVAEGVVGIPVAGDRTELFLLIWKVEI